MLRYCQPPQRPTCLKRRSRSRSASSWVKARSSPTEKLVPALLTDEDKGIAGDGVRAVELAAAPVERQPLGMAVLIDQHHRPELRRQLVQSTRADDLP